MKAVKRMSVILLLFVFIISTAYAEIDVSALSAEEYTVETDAFDGWTKITPRYFSIHFQFYSNWSVGALKQAGLPQVGCSSQIQIEKDGSSKYIFFISVVSDVRSLNADTMKILINGNSYEFALNNAGDASFGDGVYVAQYGFIVNALIAEEFNNFLNDFASSEEPHCQIRFYGSKTNVDYDNSVDNYAFGEGMEETIALWKLYKGE